MTSPDRFRLVTGSTQIFSSELPVLLLKKNRFSCITRLKVHHQIENHCKELFSTELHWEIFCCIPSYHYNFQKQAWSCDIARIKDGREGCKYLSLH